VAILITGFQVIIAVFQNILLYMYMMYLSFSLRVLLWKEHRKRFMGKRAEVALLFLFSYQQNINLQLADNETIW